MKLLNREHGILVRHVDEAKPSELLGPIAHEVDFLHVSELLEGVPDFLFTCREWQI